MRYLIHGLIMGLTYVIPIGVQNIFVINSALTQTRARALLTALIVIFFDVVLSLACFYGVGALMEAIPVLQKVILLVGSIVVVVIGVSLLRSRRTLGEAEKQDISLPKTISTACVVTWFNPQALIDGTMMLGAFRATMMGFQGTLFVIGVACASTIWFLSLTLLISLFSDRITDKMLRIVNIVCGCIIIFYGLKLFVGFLGLMGVPLPF